MTRIIDFEPSDENVIVERILVQVHKAADVTFPHSSKPESRGSKPIFADEPTMNQVMPVEIKTPREPVVPETKDQLPITKTHAPGEDLHNDEPSFTRFLKQPRHRFYRVLLVVVAVCALALLAYAFAEQFLLGISGLQD